jgi:hypothetical protein
MPSYPLESDGMSIEDQIRERLKKVEALYFGATTAGEREAAQAAALRLKAKLDDAGRSDPSIEMKFSLPDQWSVRLFTALCRRYGLRPFRRPRQRTTTVMVRGPRRFLESVLWPQFNALHADLWQYLEATTQRVIRETVHADIADAETAVEPTSLR